MAQPITSVVIANGASDSAAIPLGNLTLVGIGIPTLTSAALTFRVSVDGGTNWLPMFSLSGELSLSASTGGQYLALDPDLFTGVDYLKIRSGTNASAVTQGADRTFLLHYREHR